MTDELGTIPPKRKPRLPADRTCGAHATNGEICGHRLTRWFDGHGWRCRHHVPPGFEPFRPRRGDGVPPGANPAGDPGEPTPPVGTPCPIKKLRSLRDVERMCNWAALEVANGYMTDGRGKAIVMLCREWRSAYGDRVLKKEQDKLRQQIKDVKKGTSNRAAKQSGADDGDDDMGDDHGEPENE